LHVHKYEEVGGKFPLYFRLSEIRRNMVEIFGEPLTVRVAKSIFEMDIKSAGEAGLVYDEKGSSESKRAAFSGGPFVSDTEPDEAGSSLVVKTSTATGPGANGHRSWS
jgi:hypothetical protein